ncbi:MAG: gamma carbonic anhydrase family protein [Deltaproteobacteria bacterium]|nr:gamma carbonic anhydrase family protein [Deltaproteobacteria bacterium]
MIRKYKDILPQIHESVFVEESAQIIGDVVLGKESSVWFNATIRGDVNYIRIGNRTNVQDNCVLHVTKGTHPLVIGNDVTIGHNVTLHGCTIKDRCLLGMGSIVLDGARVGEDSIVGAGALVTEGMNVEPGTLVVGVPARPARELTDEEVKRIKKSAMNYIDYMKDYQT